MNEHYDPMPVALYARVSSDRHDVDCWQPAKVAHFETREIRGFYGGLVSSLRALLCCLRRSIV